MWSDKKFRQQLALVAFGVVLFWALFNLKSLFTHLSYLINVLSPLLLGVLLALILNVPMSALERTLFKPDKNNNYGKIKAKIKRPVSLIIALAILIGLIVLAIALILPELINTIEQMYEKVPQIAEELSDTLRNSSLLSKFVDTDKWTADYINESIKKVLENSEVMFKTLIETMNFASSIFSGILNFILATCFAIYMLMQKETLKRQLYRITTAFFRKDIANRLCDVGRMSKETFSKFIAGQSIEALILGSLCCLGMQIFGFPNALEIGVLVMVTAFIPIVGAFIGAAVGAFFIMFTSFTKALWFILFIIVLQQLEDNLIYPKIVGKTVGLPSLWVLFAITVGGTVGGILGMFVAVPAFSVFYCLFRELINYLGEKRALRDQLWEKRRAMRAARAAAEKQAAEAAAEAGISAEAAVTAAAEETRE